MAQPRCDYCGEAVEDNPIKHGSKVYCSEACAFEAARSGDCAGRTDTVMSTRDAGSGDR